MYKSRAQKRDLEETSKFECCQLIKLVIESYKAQEDGDEVEEAAEMTEELQMRNWVGNHERVS